MPAITLKNVSKIHPLRTVRAKSIKNLIVSMFRSRVEEKTLTATDGLNLIIEKGESVGVIGANGAGKTTLLRLIAGITEPTSGSIHTEGRILPLLELGAGFHPELSGQENIFLQGTLFGIPRSHIEKIIPEIISFAELEDSIHMPVKHYSSGMYVRLGFSISIHFNPDILLIDEVFSVGDIFFQRKCLEKMEQMHLEGKTFVLVSHEIDLIEQYCDRAIWIEEGKIRMQGESFEVGHTYRREVFKRSFPEPEQLADGKSYWVIYKGRFGSGAVTFDFLDVLDSDGSHRISFEHGESMQFRLRYHVSRPVSEIFCYVFLRSEHGHGAAAMANKELGLKIVPNPSGSGEVIFHVERLALSPGRYQIVSVLMTDNLIDFSSISDLHLRTNDIHIKSRPGLSQLADLELPCEWEHIPGTPIS